MSMIKPIRLPIPFMLMVTVVALLSGESSAKTFSQACRVEVEDTWTISDSMASASDHSMTVEFLPIEGDLNYVSLWITAHVVHVRKLPGTSDPALFATDAPDKGAVIAVEISHPNCIVIVNYNNNNRSKAIDVAKKLRWPPR